MRELMKTRGRAGDGSDGNDNEEKDCSCTTVTVAVQMVCLLPLPVSQAQRTLARCSNLLGATSQPGGEMVRVMCEPKPPWVKQQAS
jgi:hypothetical protein